MINTLKTCKTGSKKSKYYYRSRPILKTILTTWAVLWAVLGMAQQSSWVPQTSGTTQDIVDIQMLNQNIGFALTDNGSNSLLLKTLNGGDTWDTLFTGDDFKKIFVHSENLLYICASNQLIWKYDGNNFSSQSYSIESFKSIYFSSTNVGWVCASGGVVRKTIDGTNWSSQNTMGISENLLDIHAVDANNVWACGDNGTIIHTSDGGANWMLQTTLTTKNLHSIYFVDQNNGYAVGFYGTFLKTTDGGSTWDDFSVPSSDWLVDVYFLSVNEGFVSETNGNIYKTTDGGQNWTSQVTSTNQNIRSIFFLDSNNGWYGGLSGTIGFTDHGGDLCTTHADFTVNESCPGTISMTNASTGNFLSGGPDYTWSWEGAQWSTDVDPSYGPVAAGTYDILLEVSDGNCYDDTTVTWTVNQIDTTVVADEFCEASVYDFYGTDLTAPGTYYHTLTSSVTTCDSVIQLDLAMNLIDTTVIADEFCEASVYDFYGTDLTAPGTYYHTLTSSVTTCDSVIQLDLAMNLIDTVVVDESFCQGSIFSWNDSDYTTPGTYYYTTTSLVTDCDSVVQLDLVENPTYFIQEQHSICENENYTWHGTDYSDSGTYTAEYSTVGSGCDSIYQLELTMNPVYEFVTTESICEGEEFEWRGNFYSEENTYTETYYTAGSGCDSTFVLELTVNSLPQQVVVLHNPSNGILASGNTGEISLSTSQTGTVYWVTMGAALFTAETAGNGTSLTLGSNYPAGTYDVWSRNEFGCELLQGSVTFVEDNGNNKLTTNITFGTPATNFPAGEAVISLFKLTTDIGGEEVIILDDQQTLGSNGQVVFEDIEPGDYYLGSALNNPDNYNVAEHVYYQTAISHEDAISIPMTESTMFVADLHHQQLADEEGSNSGGGIVGEGGTKSDLTPLANMVVILRNVDTDQIIDVCVTNDSGEYEFPFIPDNTNIQMYVTSFEHQEWTPYGILTETGANYAVDFVVNGDAVYPDGTVGNDLQFASDVSIYPNPTHGVFSVTGRDLQHITITDLNGKVILEKSVNGNKTEINLSGNSKAVYLIKVESAEGTRVEKIVLK
jgi:photosystem II stability/assembly factor-like uncharacterized protein